MLGILLIDKPLGITSHDAVGTVRRRLHTKRVGHAGTLDPLATGLLLVAVGPATRFLQYLPLEPKEYVGVVRFGSSTATYDAEGEPVAGDRPVPDDLGRAIRDALPAFLGLIEQLPPMFSAVKVGGKALYHYARSGEAAPREPRRVHIGEFEIVSVEGDDATVRIVCSGGTYIRSLAHDLGQALGCGAHLVALQRTRVGRFRLEDAVSLDQVEAGAAIPLLEALPPMPIVDLGTDDVADIRQGRAVPNRGLEEGAKYALAGAEGHVFGVARFEAGLLHPECVIPAEVELGRV